MAKLPKYLYASTLADIEEGQTVYTVPWAMVVALDGTCYLDTSYDYTAQPQGSFKLRVQRYQGHYYIHEPVDALYRPHVLSDQTSLVPVEAFI